MRRSSMLKAADVAEILQIGPSKAYEVIRKLNSELDEAGFYTVRGRVSEAYFYRRFFGDDKETA